MIAGGGGFGDDVFIADESDWIGIVDPDFWSK
jgi:hypothetical protein